MHYLPDTIVAVATPPGKGGLGVVRLSGPQSLEMASKLFRPSGGKPCAFVPRRLYLGDIAIEGGSKVIDRVMAVYMQAPHSYTREDVVEISCHGGSALARLIMQELIELGARPAEPGEFTRRAFLNGAMDITMAEAVAELAEVNSALGASIAVANLSGELSDRLIRIKEQVLKMRAELEANLDFEEDVGEPNWGTMVKSLASISAEVKRLLESYEIYRRLKQGLEIIICGKVNVGKTTLFNSLLGMERGLVDSAPGTTRDWLSEEVEIAGLRLRLIDTAGVGLSAGGIDGRAVARSEEIVQRADWRLYVIDVTSPPDIVEIGRVKGNNGRGAKQIIILNKIDVVKNYKPKLRQYARLFGGDFAIIPASAKKGTGLGKIKKALEKLFDLSASRLHDRVFVNTHRQYAGLQNAFGELSRAQEETGGARRVELLAYHLANVQSSIELLLGERYDSALLDEVFRNFCIGK
jgi:tRNA modification GTPase